MKTVYKTLGSIESFTGGLFASKITQLSGASKYYIGSIISYNNKLKQQLNIDISNGVINKETALAMSKAGRKFLNVDLCVSFTGIAGPNTMENKPVGLVYIAFNDEVFEKRFVGSRKEIQNNAVKFALKKVNKLMKINTLNIE